MDNSRYFQGVAPNGNPPDDPPSDLWLWWSHEDEHTPRWWVMRDAPPEGRVGVRYVPCPVAAHAAGHQHPAMKVANDQWRDDQIEAMILTLEYEAARDQRQAEFASAMRQLRAERDTAYKALSTLSVHPSEDDENG